MTRFEENFQRYFLLLVQESWTKKKRISLADAFLFIAEIDRDQIPSDWAEAAAQLVDWVVDVMGDDRQASPPSWYVEAMQLAPPENVHAAVRKYIRDRNADQPGAQGGLFE